MRSTYQRRKGKPATVAPPPTIRDTNTSDGETITTKNGKTSESSYKVMPLDSPDAGDKRAEVTFTLRDRGVSISTDGEMTTNMFAAIFLGIWSGLPFDARLATHDLMADAMLHEAQPEKYPPVKFPIVSDMIATALRTARANGGLFVAHPACDCPDCQTERAAAANTKDSTDDTPRS